MTAGAFVIAQHKLCLLAAVLAGG